MGDAALILLCGIPASGKSTLCNKIVKSKHEKGVCFLHLDFDVLMPTEVEEKLIAGVDGGWKEFRRTILNLLRAYVCKLKSVGNVVASDDVESEDVVTSSLREKFSNILQNIPKDCTHDTVVLLDDNMYYRSMRYEYFQLARDCGLGYGELFIECDLQHALARNAARAKSVKDQTIIEMSSKIEPPSSEHCLTISSTTSTDEIFTYMTKVLKNPLPPLPVVNEELAEQSRQICSENLIQQADLILRKLIQKYMGEQSAKFDKKSIKDVGKKVNMVKKEILANMKAGIILVDGKIEGSIRDAVKDEGSALYLFVKSLFKENIAEM